MKIKIKLIFILIMTLPFFYFSGCKVHIGPAKGKKGAAIVHYINLKNEKPFGPAKLVWPDGAELYCNFGDNFLIGGNSKLYFPKQELERDVISIWWEKGYPKRFTKNFDSPEAYNKWKNEGNEPQWAKEYEPLMAQYVNNINIEKVTMCNSRKECDKLKKGVR